MRLRNPDIIHYPKKSSSHIVYLCNQAVVAHPKKITAMKGKVTCYNCRQRIEANKRIFHKRPIRFRHELSVSREHRPEYNPNFGRILDFLTRKMYNDKIKCVFLGSNWHYCELKGDIKVTTRNGESSEDSLIFTSGDGSKIEAAPAHWAEITIERQKVAVIEGRHFNLSIEFEEEILWPKWALERVFG